MKTFLKFVPIELILMYVLGVLKEQKKLTPKVIEVLKQIDTELDRFIEGAES